MSIKGKNILDALISFLIVLTLLALGIVLPKWQFFKEEIMSLDSGLVAIVLFIAIGFINIWRVVCNETVRFSPRAQGIGWTTLIFILCFVVMTMVFQHTGLPA